MTAPRSGLKASPASSGRLRSIGSLRSKRGEGPVQDLLEGVSEQVPGDESLVE